MVLAAAAAVHRISLVVRCVCVRCRLRGVRVPAGGLCVRVCESVCHVCGDEREQQQYSRNSVFENLEFIIPGLVCAVVTNKELIINPVKDPIGFL